MASPIPGMDPYLEGYLWPDVHNALANKIRQQLTPLLRPRYTARLGIYVVEDTTPESDVGIMYPTVNRLHIGSDDFSRLGGTATKVATTKRFCDLVDIQLINVEIRDAASNQLVTSIEILSPVNKREPGLSAYRLKRGRLYQASVHLIEIDLIRRGTRPISHPRLQSAFYVIALTRSHARNTDVWPFTLRDPLPTIPIPLLPPDDDVALDLAAAFTAIYAEAAYDLSIDYQQDPPPPVLAEEDRAWARELGQARR